MTPTFKERLKEIFECTEMDDHDISPCPKCEKMASEILKLVKEIAPSTDCFKDGHQHCRQQFLKNLGE